MEVPANSARPWLCDLLDSFSRMLGTALFWLPLAMMLVTVVAVFMRYLLQISIPAIQETVLYLHSALIALLAGYTLERDGHVRIDMLYRNFSPQLRAWVNLLGTVLWLIPFCLIMLNYCLDYVMQSWSVKEISADSNGLPFVWLQKSLLLLMPAVLLLQGLSLGLREAAFLLRSPPEGSVGNRR